MIKNTVNTKKIMGESFFKQIPKNLILVENDFVRLDKSIIWKCSELFWKYYNIWEELYGEDFESSLPSGISESHRKEFIHESAKNFLKLLDQLNVKKQLPQIIYIYEQGPGTGIFAREFLDYIKKNDKKYYERTMYILTDTSSEILSACKKNLREHKKHTEYFEQYTFENNDEYKGKILFARHSNVWDGWPCRNIQIRQSGLGEVYVRAVCNKKFGKFVGDIKAYGLEAALQKNTYDWKEFFRHIKLQTRTIPFSKIDIEEEPYFKYLSNNIDQHVGSNTLLSDAITNNLSFLNRLIDWGKGGYAEIVDIISIHPRKITPKKFDGSVAYIIDGNIIANWAKENNRDITFKQIRKLNTMVTIAKNNKRQGITQMIQNASYEIFPTDQIIRESIPFEKNAHLAITCTSKKGIDYTIDASSALREKGFDAYPHIIARQISDEKNLIQIQKKLIKNKLKEIFVAAGDIDNAIGKFRSAIDALHGFKKIGTPFRKVAITGYPEGHPKISNEKLMGALKEKQQFIIANNLDGRIISQLCFDAEKIVRWAVELKEKGIQLPIVIGIAGPCNILQLGQFAIKCGVGESVKFLTSKKALGKSITTNISLQYHPENIISDILEHPLYAQTNIVGIHFYTFNNIKGLISWQENIIKKEEVVKA